MDLLHDLMRYGLDTMYPKLTWIDKCSILEFANKSKAPYILKAFNKVVVDLLETSYETLVREMTINQITTIIANL
jgi:hypothetical protein